jgi:uncharacterized lipoprotein NlpE involved in copper resistance
MAAKFGVIGSIARTAASVTPHNTTKNQFAYLYVGTGGDLVIADEAGTEVTFTNLADGSYVWCRTSLVKTSSTASDILGFN